ncbi:MAG TPA: hypothetical protein ENK99_01130 [Campylobacterales bacterium]|nr:hypothetical protein [Campylobacterales bacterium]
MVFLKNIILWVFASILIFFFSSCARLKESVLVEKYIANKYIEQNASMQTLDKYSKVLDQNTSLYLNQKLRGKLQSIIPIKLKKNIVYFKINTFDKKITTTIRKECEESSFIRGIILDLRDNGGGLLSEAVSLVDLFLEKGIILKEQGRKGLDSKVYMAHKKSICKNIPLVILVNAKSASASEIVAGALQIHERATLIGSKTFGKGTIQESIGLPNNKILNITVSKYVLAQDKKIDNIGIQPDINVNHSKIKLYSKKLQFSKQAYKNLHSIAKDKNLDTVLQIGFYVLAYNI